MNKNYSYLNKNLEEKESELKQCKKTKLFYRPETTDRGMIKECIKNYKLLYENCNPNDIVLDLGANVCAFSRLISDKVKQVIAYEAEFKNFLMCQKNTENVSNIILHNKDVVSNDFIGEIAKFEILKSNNNACSNRLVDNKSKKNSLFFEVQTEKFNSILETYKPTIIKIDIEGGEYGILDKEILPNHVRMISGEVHGFRKDTFPKMYETLDFLRSQGFVITYEEVKVFQKISLINFTGIRNDIG